MNTTRMSALLLGAAAEQQRIYALVYPSARCCSSYLLGFKSSTCRNDICRNSSCRRNNCKSNSCRSTSDRSRTSESSTSSSSTSRGSTCRSSTSRTGTYRGSNSRNTTCRSRRCSRGFCAFKSDAYIGTTQSWRHLQRSTAARRMCESCSQRCDVARSSSYSSATTIRKNSSSTCSSRGVGTTHKDSAGGDVAVSQVATAANIDKRSTGCFAAIYGSASCARIAARAGGISSPRVAALPAAAAVASIHRYRAVPASGAAAADTTARADSLAVADRNISVDDTFAAAVADVFPAAADGSYTSAGTAAVTTRRLPLPREPALVSWKQSTSTFRRCFHSSAQARAEEASALVDAAGRVSSSSVAAATTASSISPAVLPSAAAGAPVTVLDAQQLDPTALVQAVLHTFRTGSSPKEGGEEALEQWRLFSLRARRLLPLLPAENVVLLLSVFGSVGLRDRVLLQRSGELLLPQLQQLRPHQLCRLLHAHAQLRTRSDLLFSLGAREAAKRAHELQPQHVVRLLHSYAALRYFHPLLLHAFRRQLLLSTAKLRPGGLLLLITALRTLLPAATALANEDFAPPAAWLSPPAAAAAPRLPLSSRAGAVSDSVDHSAQARARGVSAAAAGQGDRKVNQGSEGFAAGLEPAGLVGAGADLGRLKEGEKPTRSIAASAAAAGRAADARLLAVAAAEICKQLQAFEVKGLCIILDVYTQESFTAAARNAAIALGEEQQNYHRTDVQPLPHDFMMDLLSDELFRKRKQVQPQHLALLIRALVRRQQHHHRQQLALSCSEEGLRTTCSSYSSSSTADNTRDAFEQKGARKTITPPGTLLLKYLIQDTLPQQLKYLNLLQLCSIAASLSSLSRLHTNSEESSLSSSDGICGGQRLPGAAYTLRDGVQRTVTPAASRRCDVGVNNERMKAAAAAGGGAAIGAETVLAAMSGIGDRIGEQSKQLQPFHVASLAVSFARTKTVHSQLFYFAATHGEKFADYYSIDQLASLCYAFSLLLLPPANLLHVTLKKVQELLCQIPSERICSSGTSRNSVSCDSNNRGSCNSSSESRRHSSTSAGLNCVSPSSSLAVVKNDRVASISSNRNVPDSETSLDSVTTVSRDRPITSGAEVAPTVEEREGAEETTGNTGDRTLGRRRRRRATPTQRRSLPLHAESGSRSSSCSSVWSEDSLLRSKAADATEQQLVAGACNTCDAGSEATETDPEGREAATAEVSTAQFNTQEMATGGAKGAAPPAAVALASSCASGRRTQQQHCHALARKNLQHEQLLRQAQQLETAAQQLLQQEEQDGLHRLEQRQQQQRVLLAHAGEQNMQLLRQQQQETSRVSPYPVSYQPPDQPLQKPAIGEGWNYGVSANFMRALIKLDPSGKPERAAAANSATSEGAAPLDAGEKCQTVPLISSLLRIVEAMLRLNCFRQEALTVIGNHLAERAQEMRAHELVHIVVLLAAFAFLHRRFMQALRHELLLPLGRLLLLSFNRMIRRVATANVCVEGAVEILPSSRSVVAEATKVQNSSDDPRETVILSQRHLRQLFAALVELHVLPFEYGILCLRPQHHQQPHEQLVWTRKQRHLIQALETAASLAGRQPPCTFSKAEAAAALLAASSEGQAATVTPESTATGGRTYLEATAAIGVEVWYVHVPTPVLALLTPEARKAVAAAGAAPHAAGAAPRREGDPRLEDDFDFPLIEAGSTR